MRLIHASPAFERKLVKFLKKNTHLTIKIEKIFAVLEKDPHHVQLDTHKLHGRLAGHYACSISYNSRLIFSYDDMHIYPKSIGSHDEVY
jgi:addiction module RelE/StbE family toxin